MKNKQLNAYNEWNSKKPKPIETKVLDPSHEVINKIFKLSMHDDQLIKIMAAYQKYEEAYYFYNLGRKAC